MCKLPCACHLPVKYSCHLLITPCEVKSWYHVPFVRLLRCGGCQMFEFFGTQRQTELLQTKLDIGMVRCMREAVTSVCECRWARFLAATLLYVMRSVSLFLSSASLSIKFQLRCYSQLATNKLCLSLPPLCPSSCALTSSRLFLLPFPHV